MTEKVDYLILGGGLAGLSAAKRLLEQGISPLIIEGGIYPSHKVCGEFISSSSLPLLYQWKIPPLSISHVQLHGLRQNLSFRFPEPAGSLSHLTLDLALAKQVEKQGARLLTHTKVEQILPAKERQDLHTVQLSSGKQLKAKHLFIATGKIPHPSIPKKPIAFMGFKAHFSGLDLDNTLHMFSFPGAYLGLVPIEEGKTNFACLATIKQVSSYPCPEEFMTHLIEKQPALQELLKPGRNLFDTWMQAQVPAFGFRQRPSWPRTYWIGDAAMTIPPACGNGLSLALASGYFSAEFALKDDAKGFHTFWIKRCRSPMFFSKQLHKLFLRPALGDFCLRLGEWSPFIPRRLFSLTRDPGLPIQKPKA